MSIDGSALPPVPALVRVHRATVGTRLGLWHDGILYDLSAAPDPSVHTLDRLLAMPLEQARRLLESPEVESLPRLDLAECELLAPVESQEVWAAGVTYLRSREARMEEAVTKDIYALVYEAERPELFFKAAGWRVVPPGGQIGIRSDSEWDVPEPELAVLSNSRGEVIAYSCGNDMSSRSIEGENPLYLPQAKVYDASCSIGPAAPLAWHVDARKARIRLTVERDGREVFAGGASVGDLVRDPAELSAVLHAAYTLPVGAWLLTGTSIVPPDSYSAQPGDLIHIDIEGIGELRDEVKRIVHSGARAPARLPGSEKRPAEG